ncbi:MAG: pyridoxamine 5'-phosphate oxidase family protein [Anaerolineaceae bacterium]|nr:pyridoxamine 5'-phosphate oxidase family protein [Anaerolineaceae bacterium]
MNRVVEALREAGIFYLATVEGDQPRVRPFGAVMEYEGRIYTCTNNTKNVFAQLMENPKAEICGCRPDGTWVRVTGKLIRDDRDEAREAMLEHLPGLRNRYQVGDGVFEVFYLEDLSAFLYSMSAEPVDLVDRGD